MATHLVKALVQEVGSDAAILAVYATYKHFTLGTINAELVHRLARALSQDKLWIRRTKVVRVLCNAGLKEGREWVLAHYLDRGNGDVA